jgi:hypothetical protein
MWGFKEILWDSGAIWIIILLMFTTWVLSRAKIMIDQYKHKNNNNNG